MHLSNRSIMIDRPTGLVVYLITILLAGIVLGLGACSSRTTATAMPDVAEPPTIQIPPQAPDRPTETPRGALRAANPPAPGFNAEASDGRAIELADRVMARLGGRAAWDATRYLTWRFFGGRRHVWDRWSGDHRLEDGELVVLSNLHDRSGRAWYGDVEITDPDTLAARLDKAHASWINDSYWLVMPYKLKDTGVTLTYRGEGMTDEGLPADVVELTFQDVGRTPQNRYQVWIDIDNSLVRQWSFYREATDTEPAFVMPWANWQPHGNIWLNDDFGRRKHSEILVLEQVTDGLFTDPNEILPAK
jgi:hypothetical protein